MKKYLGTVKEYFKTVGINNWITKWPQTLQKNCVFLMLKQFVLSSLSRTKLPVNKSFVSLVPLGNVLINV